MKKNTKTLVSIIGAILILSLTGCKKESADLIIGTWQETEAIYTETIDGETVEQFSLIEPGEIVTMTFNKDNTYTSKFVIEEITSEESGIWSIENNKLTITQNDDELDFGSTTYDIELLDKDNMTLIYSETDEEDSGYSITIVMKMKKIN